MRQWSKIIIHHSATPDGVVSDWGAIRHYHMAINGWADIGYHFGVELISDAAGRKHWQWLAGRPLWQSGAHTVGQNANGIGVCLVGDYDKLPPVPEAMACLAHGVAQLCLLHGIAVDQIFGHRDFAQKSCPGKLFDLSSFRQRVAALVEQHG